MSQTAFRMYVDEVGNSDLRASSDPNHRYLSLSGVIFELEYMRDVVHPELERIKREFFDSHPDEPVVLHRKEIVNSVYPFAALRDPETQLRFNERLLRLLTNADFTVVTTVLDKFEVNERYPVWKNDPYHYCLEILIERYVLWLERRSSTGDVMAESRGGREDRRLKSAFARICLSGTSFVATELLTEHLRSQELKVKPKATNIAGLQVADLLAHPSYIATRNRRQGNELPENFGGIVSRILEEGKYDRSPSGQIDGWGRKWLP